MNSHLYPYRTKPRPEYLPCPARVMVDSVSGTKFWVTIPNPRGNTPLMVCFYHYSVTGEKKNGSFERKFWWVPYIWTPWGSDFGVSH